MIISSDVVSAALLVDIHSRLAFVTQDRRGSLRLGALGVSHSAFTMKISLYDEFWRCSELTTVNSFAFFA